jgi:hypothetical protein
MDTLEAAIRELELLQSEADDLIAAIRHAKRQYAKALNALRQGKSVESALQRAESADTRRSLTEAFESYEKRRLSSRLSLIAAGDSQGLSINSTARVWGISRQLASRYLHQVRDERGTS